MLAQQAMSNRQLLDTTSSGPMAFIEMIGKPVADPGASCFSPAMEY